MDKSKNKPGYKTTEFWLTAVAVVAGLVASAGIDGVVAKAAGLVVSALASMGYSASRAKTKAAEALKKEE